MKAAWYEKFGKAEEVLQVGERPEPTPGPGEVKVRVCASAVNPSDTKKRAGANPRLLEDGPVIPHSDGAGKIVEVGPGVPKSRIDRRVWLYNGQYGRQHGTAAEYITVPNILAVDLPDPASYEIGSMMGIPAMTAHRCVFADGDVSGKTLLITGGAGRVGYYAIQWAKYFGARVIATASNSASSEQCRDAGADLVVGHPSEESVRQILDFTRGQKVDRVIEGNFGINLPMVLDLLKIGGTIATYSSVGQPLPTIPFMQMMYMNISIQMVLVYALEPEHLRHAFRDITEMLAQERFSHRVAETYPLAEAAKAHLAIENAGNLGCVILRT